MTHGAAAYLLGRLRLEVTGEWRAIVTYVRKVADRPAERKVAEVSGTGVRPMEPPAAYASVPRLVLGKDGQVTTWEPAPPDDP